MLNRQEAIKAFSRWDNMWMILKEMKLAGYRYYLFLLIDLLIQLIIPILMVFLPARVVSLLQNNLDLNYLLIEISVWIIGILLLNFIKTYAHERITLLAFLMCEGIYWRKVQLYTLSCDLPKIENIEENTFLDEIRHTLHDNDGMGHFSGLLGMYVYGEIFIVSILGFIIYSLFAGNLHPLLLVVLFICSVINSVIKNNSLNYEQKHMDEFWENSNRFWYLKDESRNMAKAKDIRMYQLYNTFKNQLTLNAKEATDIYGDIMKHHAIGGLVIRFSSVLQYGVSYGLMIYMMQRGELSIVSFVAYIGIVAGFSSWINKIIESYSKISLISSHFSVYRSYINVKETEPVAIKSTPKQVKEIRFDDVCFGYKNNLIFDHFNLVLKENEKIALVGVNGAGKTTLTKLLCGLYPLQSGRILVDGVDISTMDSKDYRDYISILFQDFHVLPFSLAKNVACTWENSSLDSMHTNELKRLFDKMDVASSIEGIYDEEKIIRCLKRAKLFDKVVSLPKGIHTPLTQILNPDGIELSGGQTQRLMLARALYKDAPILILDEPTSALDPIAESELYEEYASLCENKISLFISHRLSSTRFCDRILFMENGAILEEGDHDSLMNLNEKYAEMYQIQGHYYQKEAKKNEAGI